MSSSVPMVSRTAGYPSNSGSIRAMVPFSVSDLTAGAKASRLGGLSNRKFPFDGGTVQLAAAKRVAARPLFRRTRPVTSAR